MNTAYPNFQNGVPELLLLQLLSQRDMYGYELVKEIQARSEGLFAFGEGCIYPILHYLEAEKYLSSQRQNVQGRSRQYYRLTKRGQRRLKELSAHWNRVARGVRLIVGESYA